jgi:hypothetical protein
VKTSDLTKGHQFEYFVGLDVLGKVTGKRVMFTVVVPSAFDRQVADICLMLVT